MKISYLIALLILIVSVPSFGQQLLPLVKPGNPLLGEVRSVEINHPDTLKKFVPGVGENWPFRVQDSTGLHVLAGKTFVINCDVMRSNIIGKAFEYIGVLYRYGHATEKGFDCSGYVNYVFNKFGLTLPRSSLAQYSASKKIDAPEAQPGDLVFFKTRGNRVSHVGIYLGDSLFIHAPGRGQKIRTQSLAYPYYKARFAGFGGVL